MYIAYVPQTFSYFKEKKNVKFIWGSKRLKHRGRLGVQSLIKYFQTAKLMLLVQYHTQNPFHFG